MSSSDRTLWRRVLAFDLGLFNVAMFFFAWLPPTTLVWSERIAMTGSAFAAVGVVAHALRRITLPGEGYAYLATALVGFYVLLVYVHSASAPWTIKAPFCLFIASGIASGLAAHVIDGGPARG